MDEQEKLLTAATHPQPRKHAVLSKLEIPCGIRLFVTLMGRPGTAVSRPPDTHSPPSQHSPNIKGNEWA